jgi:hypothetical protein
MTKKAGLSLDMAVFCLQSSVILTFICVIDSNCERFIAEVLYLRLPWGATGDALSKAVSLRKIESEPKNCIMSVLFCLRITHYLLMTLIRDVSYGKDKQRHHADFG